MTKNASLSRMLLGRKYDDFEKEVVVRSLEELGAQKEIMMKETKDGKFVPLEAH